MTAASPRRAARPPGALTLPGEYYTARDVYEEEMRRLFGRRWLCVDRADRLQNAGDYILATVGHHSVIVVRDAVGDVRALHNVCRHRGTRLCEAASGRFRGTIQCPYHAWTYGLDGQLIGAPHMSGVPGFDRVHYPLLHAALGVWEGFLFLSLAPAPPPLDRAFAPLLPYVARFQLASLRSGRRIEYDVRANWKLLFLNYSECLHCPVIHPALAKLTPYQSGHNELAEGPYLGGYMTITREGGSMTMSGGPCGPAVAGLAPEDYQRVYYYSLFPNMLLSLHPDYVMFHTFWPSGPSRTRVVCEWLFPPAALEPGAGNPDDAVEFWDMTNRQDWHICERSQEGIASPAYTPGPYSEREALLAAWDLEYLRQMGRAE